MIRDRATWNAVVRRFGQRPRSDVFRDSSRIDWNHEMVLLVSYGSGLAELEEDWGVNRAETRNDTLVITMGPDSLVGKQEIFVDGIIFPQAFALPRSNLPVRFEQLIPDNWIPRVVDWR